MMLSYFQIFKIYYTSLSLVKWLAVIGLLIYCSIFFIDAPKAYFPISMLTLLLSFGFPFLFMASTFRVLISNRRFSLVPGFHLKAGLCLLAFTIFISLFPCVHILFFAKAELSPWLPFVFGFTFSSVYIFIAQSLLSAKNPQIVSWLLMCFAFGILFLGNQFSKQLSAIFLNEMSIGLLFLTSIIGWIYALKILGQKSVFTFNKSYNLYRSKEVYSIENAGDYFGWMPSLHKGFVRTPHGTLMRSAYDDLKSRILRIGSFTIFSPIIFGGLFAFMNEEKSPFEYYKLIVLLMLAVSASFGGVYASEWVARMRYLWLRGQYNRKDLWRMLEKQMIQALLTVYAFSLTFGAVVFLISDFPSTYFPNFIFLVISVSLFFSYFTVYCRIKESKGLLLVGVAVFALFVVLGVIFGVLKENFIALNLFEGFMLMLSFVLHKQCAKAFEKIDWISVKPATRISPSSI